MLYKLTNNPLLSAVSAAEDPEKILEQAVEDMQGDLIKLRQAAAEVTASEKRMEAKYEQAQKTADEWYRRHRRAGQHRIVGCTPFAVAWLARQRHRHA